MGVSSDIVKRNIELMIKKNYFVNAYVNQETNCIVLGGGNTVKKQQENNSVQSYAVELVPVACKCCGGMNQVPRGRTVECEYCGSPING